MIKLPNIPFIENQIRWLKYTPEVAHQFKCELQALSSRNTSKPSKLAIIWKIKSNLQSEFKSVGLPVLSFSYRNLITNRNEIICRIAEQAGLDLHENMTQHHTVYKGYGPGGTQRDRPLDSNSLNHWRNSLPAAIADEIENISLSSNL